MKDEGRWYSGTYGTKHIIIATLDSFMCTANDTIVQQTFNFYTEIVKQITINGIRPNFKYKE